MSDGVAAMTAQGLDKVTERLTADGVLFDVEQTGGWVMAVVVRHDRTYVATADDSEIPTFVVGTYDGDGWAEGDEPAALDEGVSLDEAVRMMSAEVLS